MRVLASLCTALLFGITALVMLLLPIERLPFATDWQRLAAGAIMAMVMITCAMTAKYGDRLWGVVTELALNVEGRIALMRRQKQQ